MQIEELELKVEEDFVNALLGVHKPEEEYPGRIIHSNLLRVAYDQARASGLNEKLILKHCCTVLQKRVDDNLSEKFKEMIDKPSISKIGVVNAE